MAPRIVLHFHPGWPFGDGTVLDAVVSAGRYRSQWETGTSNGGLTAFRGGDRWAWESRLFGGRYDAADPGDRPVYGAWDRREDPYGAAPRFGSAYLRLRPEVVSRSTFCWPDSVADPEETGGPERLAELCALADAHVCVSGTLGTGVVDPLDDYVEAHVHGGVLIDRDVEALVLDPTDHEALAPLADELGCPVEVHAGYRVTADGIDPAYRGPEPVSLARRLGGVLTPARLAAAARSGEHDPQAVKWAWHCLARFGRAPGSDPRLDGSDS